MYNRIKCTQNVILCDLLLFKLHHKQMGHREPLQQVSKTQLDMWGSLKEKKTHQLAGWTHFYKFKNVQIILNYNCYLK